MSGYRFTFHGHDLVARGAGALYWPERRALLVADLHLGKAQRQARRAGQLLPPFETRDTLARLEAELQATGAERLFLLGDSYDDDLSAAELMVQDRARLDQLAAQHAITAITGNHDPSQPGVAELTLNGITLRHEAASGPDISGHFHPKCRVAGQRIAAFLIGRDHLILPAFGTYTGGLDADAPVLRDLVGPGIAVLTGRTPRPIPLNR